MVGVLAANDHQGFNPNSWGYDVSAIDRNVRPGDGFDAYANGAWAARVTIPAERRAWTITSIGQEQAAAQLRGIMEEAAASETAARPTTSIGKVGAFYASYMDQARIDALGAQPTAADLAVITAASTRDDLAALMGQNPDGFQGSIVLASVFADLKNPAINVGYIGQPTLTLPDRDYYLEPQFAEQKAAYQAYVAKMLGMAGWADPEANAAKIVAYEAKIAGASWTKVEQRDITKLQNPRTVSELEQQMPGFPWRSYLKAIGFPDRVVVNEVTALPKIAAIFAQTPLPVLKAWAAFNVADNAAPYLSTPFADAWFDFHKRTLSGVGQRQPRWKEAVHQVSGGDFLTDQRSEKFGTMGWAVGEAYTERYFPASSKAAVRELVENLRSAFRARLERATWMTPATKAQALKKLAALRVKIGYPDRPQRDYGTLLIDRGDLYGNVRRAAELEWKVQTGRIGQPVDHNEWSITPQTPDAYNDVIANEIAFPAVHLQPPFFSPGSDPAVNYGGIGATIGHELTHGFDDQGRLFDETGAMRDWWAATDTAHFVAQTRVLGAQYSSYEPLPGVRVNGDLTMGENIADLGGLLIAYDAYHAALGRTPAPVLDGYTGDQRFFLGYAQSWRGRVRDEFLRQYVMTDVHSPPHFRIEGIVRNVDAWYAAFGVRAGDKLYLEPDQRARIW